MKTGLYYDKILDASWLYDGIDWYWMDNEYSWINHACSPSPSSLVKSDMVLFMEVI